MIDTSWIRNAQTAFIALYGEKKGLSVCGAVIPGIMGDFRRMLTSAEEGRPVRETYRLDDGKGDIRLEGYRDASGCVITRLSVAGRDVDIGGKLII